MQNHTPWKQKRKQQKNKNSENESNLGFKKGMLGKFVQTLGKEKARKQDKSNQRKNNVFQKGVDG